MYDNVDVTFLVTKFVTLYLKNKQQAVIWADKNIDPVLYPKMKPEIQKRLRARGYIAKAEEFK